MRGETRVWTILKELVVLLEAVGGGCGGLQVGVVVLRLGLGLGLELGALVGVRDGEGVCCLGPRGGRRLAGVGSALCVFGVFCDLVELLLARGEARAAARGRGGVQGAGRGKLGVAELVGGGDGQGGVVGGELVGNGGEVDLDAGLQQSRGSVGQVADQDLATAIQQEGVQGRLVLVGVDLGAQLGCAAGAAGEEVDRVARSVLEQEPAAGSARPCACVASMASVGRVTIRQPRPGPVGRRRRRPGRRARSETLETVLATGSWCPG